MFVNSINRGLRRKKEGSGDRGGEAGAGAAKARGVKLGGFRGYRLTEDQRAEGSAKGAEAKAGKARQEALSLLPVVDEIQSAGAVSLRAIAAELNRRGVKTPKGGDWHANSVARLLARLREAAMISASAGKACDSC